MLDNILDSVKGMVSNFITNNDKIPEDKKDQVVETTTEAVGDGIKQNFNLSNISDITSMFTNGAMTNSNPVVHNITTNVINSLVKKVGLSPGLSNSIASTVVPMVMNLISGKMKNSGGSGFNLESLISSISGSGNNNKGNLVGEIEKIFG